MKAPHISKRPQLPLVLITTPEITSLPPSLGPLAEIISTQGGGGLGDISGSLITEFDRLGLNVRVVVPEYKKMFERALKKITDVHEGSFEREYNLMKKDMEKSKINLIEDEIFRTAEHVYGDENTMLDQIELRKADAFQEGIISRMLPTLKVDNQNIIVHCNDWTTGIIPAAARNLGIMSLMTVHNIFTYHQTPYGLKKHSIYIEPYWKDLFFKDHPDKFGGTFEGNYTNNSVDFMASGIACADFVNTVSPTFLKEIVNDYFMAEGIIPDSIRNTIKKRNYEGSATGILNAPSDLADPRKDPYLSNHYWIEEQNNKNILDVEEGKNKNKREFQNRIGLREDPDAPIFFWPSRIVDPQKGFWLINDLTPHLLAKYNLQIAVVADGDATLINQFKAYTDQFPGKASYMPFERSLNRLGTAGSDFILMPSMYEPCGIPQLEGPIYGTLAVGRQTGGLADSIEQLSPTGLNGNGFLFTDMIPSGLWHGIESAMAFYNKGSEFRNNVRKRVMKESSEKFNINQTAKQYIEVYNEILSRRGINEKCNG